MAQASQDAVSRPVRDVHRTFVAASSTVLFSHFTTRSVSASSAQPHRRGEDRVRGGRRGDGLLPPPHGHHRDGPEELEHESLPASFVSFIPRERARSTRPARPARTSREPARRARARLLSSAYSPPIPSQTRSGSINAASTATSVPSTSTSRWRGRCRRRCRAGGRALRPLKHRRSSGISLLSGVLVYTHGRRLGLASDRRGRRR